MVADTPLKAAGPSGQVAITTLGHDVEYQIDWDDGTFSAWSSSLSASHAWAAAGSYRIKATARCAIHTSILSDPGTAFEVVITDAAETVSAPTHLSSQTTFTTPNTSIWCSAGGSVSSHAHDVEYQLDWDDGSMTAWGIENGASTNHTWTDYGVYEFKARARCIADTLVVSEWSAPRYITVRERISNPSIPTGPTSGVVGQTLTYTCGGAISTDGHALEYRIRSYYMGSFVTSDWSASPVIDHVFLTAGQHQVTARARCAIHTDAQSNWSYGRAVTISNP